MVIFEVKGTDLRNTTNAEKGVFPKEQNANGWSPGSVAARQLIIHLSKLNEELEWKEDWIERKDWTQLKGFWVKLCAFFPRFDGKPGDEQAFKTMVKEKIGNGAENIQFIHNQSLFSDLKRLLDIEATVVPVVPPSSIDPQQHKKMLTLSYLQTAVWCLLHSFGVILSHRSNLIDQEHENLCQVAPSQILTTGMSPRTTLALLTAKQMHILTSSPTAQKPVLILGKAGTGKTFLVRMKIKQLAENNKLKIDAKALVVVHPRNYMLLQDLKLQLSYLGDKVVICARNGTLKGLAEELKKDLANGGFKYVFLDQLEDFVKVRTKVVAELKDLFKILSDDSQLMWILGNGRHYDFQVGSITMFPIPVDSLEIEHRGQGKIHYIISTIV